MLFAIKTLSELFNISWLIGYYRDFYNVIHGQSFKVHTDNLLTLGLIYHLQQTTKRISETTYPVGEFREDDQPERDISSLSTIMYFAYHIDAASQEFDLLP